MFLLTARIVNPSCRDNLHIVGKEGVCLLFTLLLPTHAHISLLALPDFPSVGADEWIPTACGDI